MSGKQDRDAEEPGTDARLALLFCNCGLSVFLSQAICLGLSILAL